jgi:hypothetical protein
MTQFDPSRPSLVHERLNAKTFEWSPEWRASFERYKRDAGLGVVSWDGLLLDGWAPIEVDRSVVSGGLSRRLQSRLPVLRGMRAAVGDQLRAARQAAMVSGL